MSISFGTSIDIYFSNSFFSYIFLFRKFVISLLFEIFMSFKKFIHFMYFISFSSSSILFIYFIFIIILSLVIMFGLI
jgi:hypothetical protein